MHLKGHFSTMCCKFIETHIESEDKSKKEIKSLLHQNREDILGNIKFSFDIYE